ncbi:MAG: hypothetical protein WAO08_01970 [Hyphomicrobiaceae bacterium]
MQPPTRRSFGTRLIENGLPHPLDGKVKLDFLPGGAVCAMMPLVKLRPENSN